MKNKSNEFKALETVYQSSFLDSILMKIMIQESSGNRNPCSCCQMVPTMKESGTLRQNSAMAEDIRYGVMEVFMKATGNRIKQMVAAD